MWTLLDDLDFADNLVLLSHSHYQMQDNTTTFAAASPQVGLNIHKGKMKIIRMNATSAELIALVDRRLEEVQSFTYLESIIDKEGGTEAARIGMARTAFLQLKNIWCSRA